MFLASSFFLAILLTVSTVICQSNSIDKSKSPRFLFPDKEGETFYSQDILNVQYISFFDNVELWTFCQQGVGKYITQQQAPGFNATVPIRLNFTNSDQCWFSIRTGPDKTTYSTNSLYFNGLGERRPSGPQIFPVEERTIPLSVSQTPSSTPSSTPTSTASFTSPSSPSNVPAVSALSEFTSATPTTRSSVVAQDTTLSSQPAVADSESTALPNAVVKPNQLHPAAWTAIGFSIAVVIIGLVAASFYLRVQRRLKQSQIPASDETYGKNTGSIPQWQYGGELDTVRSPVEMAIIGPAVELPSQQAESNNSGKASFESGCLGAVGDTTRGRGGVL
ncbi:hypothetical protein QBC44DRAFT_372152 [Cladorrhinum sp. PSN332]|nr:hypothetical protein QBC44DRAFT_372152 [Cladorrhinum sp. PSN332]